MNRRSFVMSLFGGVAATGLGGTAIAQAASPKLETMPTPGEIDAAAKAGLDQADADFSQYRPHRPHRRPHRRPPPPPPRHRRRRRRVVRNGRVYWVY